MNFAVDMPLPARVRPDTPMTDDELLRFCAANDMLRIERDANGELILMSPSGAGTGQTNADLNYQLTKWARETNSGATFDSNAGFTLRDTSMRSPDASFISWPRWNAIPKDQQAKFAPICPEFVMELRSPSDSLRELQEKMKLWIANGAELAWLVDPSRKTVEVYRPNREPEVLEGGSVVEGKGLWLVSLWSWGVFGVNSQREFLISHQ